MSTSDELLFGTEQTRGRDSDGDGVSDVQEAIDGTDANDAADSIRHDGPVLRATGDPRGDVRGDLERGTLEREVNIDVAAANPSTMSLDQALPMGLDGKPVGSGHTLGNAEADKLMSGHVDENSPLNFDRDPVGASTPKPSTGGHGSQVGGGGGGDKFSGGIGGPPPGADTSFRSPKWDQVADGELPEYQPKAETGDARVKWIAERDEKAGKVPDTPLKEYVPPAEPPKEHVPLPPQIGPKRGMTDPDAGGGGTVIDVSGGGRPPHAEDEPRVVRGFGSPPIEGDAPPGSKFDPVADPNPDADEGTGTTTGTPPPPGGGYTDPTNPKDLLPNPSGPPGPGGDDQGLQGNAQPAMAAESTEGGGIQVADGGSTGSGIQNVVSDDVTGLPPAAAVSQGIIIPEIDRVADQHAQPGDRFYIDRAAPVEELQVDAAQPNDRFYIDRAHTDDVPVPLDPVAEAMVDLRGAHEVAAAESFEGLQIDDAVAIPAEQDLDDGI